MKLSSVPGATGAVLTAGIVLAGGGVFSAAPPAAWEISGVQRHEVVLSATTQENLDNLATLLSGENPLTKVTAELAQQYSTEASQLFADSMKGVEHVFTGDGANVVGLNNLMPIISGYIDEGNYTEAFNVMNNDVLFDLRNIFQPWFTHETFRHSGVMTDGIFTIPSHITHDLANLQGALADYDLWKHALEALAAPAISFNFALADQFTDTGDHIAQDPIDALINGYVPWGPAAGTDDTHRPLIGLLTEGGPIDYFGRQVPEQLADGLAKGLPDSAASDLTATELLDDADVSTTLPDDPVSGLDDGAIEIDPAELLTV